MRILLFLATNAAILVLISLTFRLLGIDGLLEQSGGMDMQALLVMSAVIGFGGAFISLFLSKWMAKRSMGVRLIEHPASAEEHWLLETVRQQAQRAGIQMPEVGIFDSPDPNAFATGWNRNAALVAVSTGLLRGMNRDEVEAVLGHEVSHVANGDMVTLTLIQGVVNTFVVFLARLFGHFVDRVVLKNENGHGIGYFVATIVAELVLAVLASVIVMWFSRRREFRADIGGAELAGRQKMIAALQRLQAAHEPQALPDEMAAFGISGNRSQGWKRLFMSHPPLDERIRALQQAG
ncbi:MAG: protease HtpX [Gammaproteobacteria bacterium SHHR-1]|uniref:protease HtpX n=1 Tax=Magnetovirga frankeli TaxID=947516 RepID=UPI0012932F25|nr:protease HtpX [gamma proteobacterium SS-5]